MSLLDESLGVQDTAVFLGKSCQPRNDFLRHFLLAGYWAGKHEGIHEPLDMQKDTEVSIRMDGRYRLSREVTRMRCRLEKRWLLDEQEPLA